MIDVVFSILAFFIMSSLFLTRSEGLPVNLPKATTAQAQKSIDFTVTVGETGEVFLNREPISIAEMGRQIDDATSPDSPALATINADETVPHGRVVQIMDRLRRIEGLSLGISTQAAPEEELWVE